nr:MinD [Ochrosphaera neapolitana]
MARTIVITSGKGGVGKTTTTSNIGMALAQLEKKVLLLDADVGLRNLDLLLGLENRIMYTGVDVIMGTCKLEQALIKDKRQPNLFFCPLSSNQSKHPITKQQLKSLIEQVDPKFDFVLIDSPAGIDAGFQTAVAFVKEAFVVVTPEVTSIRDADKVIGILGAQEIEKIQLIINRVRPDMIKSETMMSVEDIKEILGIQLIGVIPDSERVIIASNRGEPLILEKAPSLPKIAFEDTAQRLLGKNIPFLNLELASSKNPVKRLFGNLLRSKKGNHETGSLKNELSENKQDKSERPTTNNPNELDIKSNPDFENGANDAK